MDVRPTPEQRELGDAADRLATRLGPATVGDLDDTDRKSRLDAALGQAGWRELRTGDVNEPLASGVEAAFVARSLARRPCDTSFVGPLLAQDLLRRAGYTEPFAAVTVAASADLGRIGTSTERLVAIDAEGSTSALVLIASNEGFQLGHVPIAEIATGVDITRPIGVIPASTSVTPLVGTHLTRADLTGWTSLALAVGVADLLGLMEGALALATDYAKERRQYGAPIGSYQAVQHLLAEAAALVEGTTSVMLHAAWAADALPPADARLAAAVAKAYASRAARTVCETVIQVHGGIGNTWECMAHVYLRRALLSTELFGGEGHQLALIATSQTRVPV